MKVWTNNEFEGRWPVPTAAVVAAETAEDAAEMLNTILEVRGLPRSAKPEQFRHFPGNIRSAVILSDGDY